MSSYVKIELMRKAELYEELEDKKVKCTACQHRCVIASGDVGFCETRLNKNGTLHSLIYGILNGIQADPIEKKPLYHFHPGTQVLSLGSYGCNYRCKQCLNWHCSWGEPAAKILQQLKAQGSRLKERIISPKEIVELAMEKQIPGIAFTYNEPSIWPEYVHDTAKLAKEKGLYTVFVSNGMWTKEQLNYLGSVIDAANIDIKGYSKETYKKMGAFRKKVLENCALAKKKYNIFIELTTLIIPTINDSEKELKSIAKWIKKEMGKDTPWHLSRFDPNLAPDDEFRKLDFTPTKTLKKAYEIGKDEGLENVYVWAPAKGFGDKLFSVGDTVCPKCGKKVITRDGGWRPEMVGVEKKQRGVVCKFCGEELNLIL